MTLKLIRRKAKTSSRLLLDAEAADRDRAQEAPGLAFAVSATTLAAIPAEATPNSTSAVLRHTQVQFIRGKPLHGADEVENVVLILCRDQLPKQL